MPDGILGDAHAGVRNLQESVVFLPCQGDFQGSPGYIVLDTVLHEIENNLIQVVFQNQDGTVSGQIRLDGHILLSCQRGQHPNHPLNGGGHIDDFGLLVLHTVNFGQRKHFGSHPVQAFRLVANVAHKLPNGFHIHVVLQNGVCQELDGCQRCFQLVGSVGDEAVALLLRGLKPFRQIIKFIAQQGQLIVAANVHLVGIIPLLNNPHGGHDPLQTPGEGRGKGQRENRNDNFQNQGNLQNIVLQGANQNALRQVILCHIHASDDAAIIDNRRGGPGVYSTVVKVSGENIVALHGLQYLGEENVAAYGCFLTVIQGKACMVCYNQPGGGHAVHLADNAGDGGGVQNLQLRDLIGSQMALFQHGGLFALVKQLLAGIGAIDVQNQKYYKGNGNISNGIIVLGVAIAAQRGFPIF